MTNYSKELQTAILAAQKAGEYLKNNQEKVTLKKFKEHKNNYTTEQDLKAEKIIMKTIKKNFSHDFILSEEFNPNAQEQERMWIVDPLDGTRNYANGSPYFCTSIALYEKGEPKVAVIYAPSYNNELFHAVRGKGAFLNKKPFGVFNPSQNLENTIVATGFAYFKYGNLTKPLKIFESVLNQTTDIRRLGAAALDLCQVATGRIGAYYEEGIKPWDVAAGILIINEQKGMFSNYKGNKLNLFERKGESFYLRVLASKNKGIHEKLKGILNSKYK